MAQGPMHKINPTVVTDTAYSVGVPPDNQNHGYSMNGYIEVYGGTNGTSVLVGGHSFSVAAQQYIRVPVSPAEVINWGGGLYTSCAFYGFKYKTE